MLLVLAHAPCSSGACHGVWVDPSSSELYVVGDRTSSTPAGSDGLPLSSVRVSMRIYEAAVAVLRDATEASGVDHHLVADIRSGWAYLAGRSVASPPAGIGVAAHEEAVVVGQLAPALVTALARSGG